MFNSKNDKKGIKIEGSYLTSFGADEEYYYQSTTQRSVDAMFDRFAMGCTNMNRLLKVI